MGVRLRTRVAGALDPALVPGRLKCLADAMNCIAYPIVLAIRYASYVRHYYALFWGNAVMVDGWAATLIAESEVLAGIETASISDLDAGEATPLDSEADALNSPLGPAEVKQLLEALTVVAGSTAALADLTRALVELVRRLRKPEEIADTAGRKVITITVDTDEAALLGEITVKCKLSG